jgi:hypothetical protein
LILMDFYWTLMIFRQAALLWLCHISAWNGRSPNATNILFGQPKAAPN